MFLIKVLNKFLKIKIYFLKNKIIYRNTNSWNLKSIMTKYIYTKFHRVSMKLILKITETLFTPINYFISKIHK